MVAGSADHICPWRNCYASTQLLGGTSRFVLSTNGHIAALVNPPEERRSPATRSPTDTRPTRQEWADAARTEQGSWWPDYAGWLAERSGERVAAPTTLGGKRFRPLGAAPGSYVLDT